MTRQELSDRIKYMALLMAEISAEIDYFAGFDVEMSQKADELANAAAVAWKWHEHLNELTAVLVA